MKDFLAPTVLDPRAAPRGQFKVIELHVDEFGDIRDAAGLRLLNINPVIVDIHMARIFAAAPELYEALEMVRDADDDCLRDGLPTIPPMARAKIDAAMWKARNGALEQGQRSAPSMQSHTGTTNPTDREG